MNILLVSESYPPIISGVSKVLSSYAKALTAMRHEVSVITSGTTHKTEIIHEPEGTIYREKTIRNPIRQDTPVPIPSYRRMKQFIQNTKPDIVHIHTQGPLGLTALYIAHKLHIPTVASLHAPPQFVSSYAPFGSVFRTHIDNFLWYMLLHHVFPFVSHVLVPSSYMQGEFLKRGAKNLISVLPMWIDPLNMAKPKPRKGKTNFLSLGRLDSDKNLSLLIEAWIIYKRMNPRTHTQLTIAGGGTEEKNLQQRAKKDTTRSISFVGRLEPERVPALLGSNDIVVVPGLYESQSLVALEALAANCKVLVAESGALPEIATRFPAYVHMFPPGNAHTLALLLTEVSTMTHPTNPPDLSHYAKEKILKNLLQIYKKYAKNGKSLGATS